MTAPRSPCLGAICLKGLHVMTVFRSAVALLAGWALVACQAPVQAPTVTAPATTRVAPTTSSTAPAARSCHAANGKADRSCTPGAINPQVTQINIGSTICRKGWTATIRPPASFTEPLKRRQMAAYGDTGSPNDFEEDHLVPLEIGGNPTDEGNLWPEPRTGSATAAKKDVEENSLNRAVCGGRLKLADAQAQILRDWRT